MKYALKYRYVKKNKQVHVATTWSFVIVERNKKPACRNDNQWEKNLGTRSWKVRKAGVELRSTSLVHRKYVLPALGGT